MIIVPTQRKIIKMQQVVPVVSESVAYTNNDSVGAMTTIQDFFDYPGQHAILHELTYTDAAANSAVFQIFFHKNNAASVSADNAAWTLDDADAALVSAFLVTTASLPAFIVIGGQNSFFTSLGATHLLPLTVTSVDRNLYVSMRASSGTPTYAAATDLKFNMIFEMGL